MTTRELITECFQDMGVLAAGESLSAADADNGLSKLARLFDNWNAERRGVYATRFTTYTLVPDLSPHTIGPLGTFVTAQRPVTIEGIDLVLNDVTPSIERPIAIRDADWYQELSVPSLSTSVPTDVYYQPEWPLGKLFFWPIPTTAYDVVIRDRIVLAALGLDDALTLPPGYRDAVTLTLGEMLMPSYPGSEVDTGAARRARARIFANNDTTPRLRTADAGMPAGGASNAVPTYYYRTGQDR